MNNTCKGKPAAATAKATETQPPVRQVNTALASLGFNRTQIISFWINKIGKA